VAPSRLETGIAAELETTNSLLEAWAPEKTKKVRQETDAACGTVPIAAKAVLAEVAASEQFEWQETDTSPNSNTVVKTLFMSRRPK
jgi:hypothetical protein